MKNKTNIMVGLMKWITVCAALAWLPSTLLAANQAWSTQPTAGGGNGTWNSVDANWYSTYANYGYSVTTSSSHAWLDGDTAFFGTPAAPGTFSIGVDGVVIVGVMNLNRSAVGVDTLANTYIFNSGTIRFANAATSGNVDVLINYGNAVINSNIELFTNGEGAQEWNFNNAAANAQLTVAGNITSYAAVAGKGLRLKGKSGSVLAVNGDITAPSNKLKITIGGDSNSDGDVTYILGGNNTGVGSMEFTRGGTLVLNHSNALGGAGVTGTLNTGGVGAINVVTGKGNLNIANNFYVSNTTYNAVIGGAHTSDLSSFSGTINIASTTHAQVTQIAGGTTAFSGNITDGNANNQLRTVTKTGEGVVIFATANTYRGGTIVAEGTLLVNAVLGSGTGVVTVNSGATLGGKGSVRDVILDGFLAPGEGGFTVNNLTWNGNADGLVFNLGAAGTDLLTVNAFAKGTAGDFTISFNDAGVDLITYDLVDFKSTTFDLADFSYTTTISGLTGDFGWNGNILQFTVTNIPEPSTLFLLGTGVALLAVLRRRAK